MNNNVHPVNGESINRAVACLKWKVANAMINEEIEYRVLKLLEANPELSQRELSSALGVSLGKTHYVLKGLMDVGWVKMKNFRRSNNKMGYAYVLTPVGLIEKVAITLRFLARKQHEFNALQAEIQALQAEVETMGESPQFTGSPDGQTD